VKEGYVASPVQGLSFLSFISRQTGNDVDTRCLQAQGIEMSEALILEAPARYVEKYPAWRTLLWGGKYGQFVRGCN
jgi:hypothetical protein